jgi:hypothetical protein
MLFNNQTNVLKGKALVFKLARIVLAGVQLILVLTFVTFLVPSTVITQIGASPISDTNTSIYLPLSKGYVKGTIANFIATDTSNNQTATSISKNLGYKVNYAPSLSLVPESAQQKGYEFLNGIKGEGAFGFQLGVASALPKDKGYSPIVQLNFVKWNDNATVRELKSAEDLLSSQLNGELEITKTEILINTPAILQQ